MAKIGKTDNYKAQVGYVSNVSDNHNFSLRPLPQKNKKTAEDITKEDLKGEFTGYLTFCLVMSVIGAAFQVGWNIGLYNTPQRVIRAFYNQTFLERYGEAIGEKRSNLLWSVTNGLLPLGATLGGLSSALTAEFFGRKYGLIFGNLFVIAAGGLNIMSKFIKSYESLMVARFLSGIFCGLFTGILPLYLSELPPQNYRGLVGTLNQFGIVFGILVTNVLGLPNILGSVNLWPVLVGLMVVPVIAHVLLLLGAESPKYLYISQNQPDEAREVLLQLRGKDSEALVENELLMLKSEKEQKSNLKEVSWSNLLDEPSLRHPLLIAVGVMISQQFSGINAVIFYSTKIFEDAGFQRPALATIVLGIVQLVMTLVCLFIIERAGRKALLLIGTIGMCLSAFALAIFRITNTSKNSTLNLLTVAAAIVYIIAFSIGPGPIPWLLTSELFSSEARAKANSVSTFTNWACAFIVTVGFPFLERAIKDYSFIVFGCLLVIFTIFILIFVPETKNKSSDEVKLMLASESTFVAKSDPKKGEVAKF